MDQAVTPNDFDFSHAGELGDRLFPLLNELRERDPVHWDEKSRCWIITRHADISDALYGRVPVSNLRLAQASISAIPRSQWAEKLPNLIKYSPYHITNMDPPNHTRMRGLLTKAFSRNVVEALRPYAQGIITGLMDKMRQPGEVEFADIALALPGNVILKLLGLPEEFYPRLRVWANDVMVGLGTPNPDAEWVIAADRAFAELTAAALPIIKNRRETPHRPDDFISSLVHAKDGKDGLSEDEIVGVLQVAVIAGHDTTANSMTLGIEKLARAPQAWAHMAAHPEQMMASVLELMRYSAMSTAQNRAVAHDFEWHGKQIRKGDTIFLMFAAGNRDPRAYANPEALDLSRPNDQSLTFGPGIHHCIGHLLAKMQLTEFFTALTANFSGAQVLDDEVKFANILAFRAIPSLRMQFQPR